MEISKIEFLCGHCPTVPQQSKRGIKQSHSGINELGSTFVARSAEIVSERERKASLKAVPAASPGCCAGWKRAHFGAQPSRERSLREGRNSPFGRLMRFRRHRRHRRRRCRKNGNACESAARACEHSRARRGIAMRREKKRVTRAHTRGYVKTRRATTCPTSRAAVATLNALRTPVAVGRLCRRRAAEALSLARHRLCEMHPEADFQIQWNFWTNRYVTRSVHCFYTVYRLRVKKIL